MLVKNKEKLKKADKKKILKSNSKFIKMLEKQFTKIHGVTPEEVLKNPEI